MCMSYYNWEPVENQKPLFAVVKWPCRHACEEVESQHPVSEISICEPQSSITQENIGARLSTNEFEI